MTARLNRSSPFGRQVLDGVVGSSPQPLTGRLFPVGIDMATGIYAGEKVYQDTSSLNGQDLSGGAGQFTGLDILSGGACSIFCRFHLVSTSGGGSDYAFRFASDSGDVISVSYNGAAPNLNLNESGMTAIAVAPGPTWASGTTYSVFMRFSASGNDFSGDMYNHTTKTWSQATSETTVTSTFATWRYFKAGDTSSRDSRMSLLLFLNGYLSDASMRSLAYLPWQIFEGPDSYIPVTTAAATGTALIPRDVPWHRKPPG